MHLIIICVLVIIQVQKENKKDSLRIHSWIKVQSSMLCEYMKSLFMYSSCYRIYHYLEVIFIYLFFLFIYFYFTYIYIFAIQINIFIIIKDYYNTFHIIAADLHQTVPNPDILSHCPTNLAISNFYYLELNLLLFVI